MLTASFIGTVAYVKRMRSSINGNPKFEVTLIDGSKWQTATDSMVAYEIDNREYRENECTITTDYGRIVKIVVNKNGL